MCMAVCYTMSACARGCVWLCVIQCRCVHGDVYGYVYLGSMRLHNRKRGYDICVRVRVRVCGRGVRVCVRVRVKLL